VTRLYKEYDFDGTLACIKEIKIEAEKDILTSNKSSLIVNTLYTLLFETYCAIYSAVEISKVSEWVELNEEESEIWIVNLARKNNLNAKLTVNSTGEKVMTFKAATDKSKKEVIFGLIKH
jgi:translation initiation factor 3 subunit E